MAIEAMNGVLRAQKSALRDSYDVESIGIFGSHVRGAQNKKSDLDMLVELYRTIKRFTFVGPGDFLSEVPGVKVDLVMKSTLKPRIKDRILKEAVYL